MGATPIVLRVVGAFLPRFWRIAFLKQAVQHAGLDLHKDAKAAEALACRAKSIVL